MNARVIAIVWGLAVTAVQIALSLALRARLPDPLATHWGLGGRPNGSMSFPVFLAMEVLIWTVVWVTALAVAERVSARRQGRVLWWGVLFAMSVFSLGLKIVTLLANLDAVHWTEARLQVWQVPAVVAAAIGIAALAGYLGRGAPDEPAPGGRRPPLLRLRAGQRTVWVGHVANRWLTLILVLAAAALVVLGLLSFVGVVPDEVAVRAVPALVILLAVGLLTSSVSVRVGDDRVVIRFGALGRPARRIPVSRIESAWTETRHPSAVGGWGFRGLPGNRTIMLRGGECLVIGYRSGGRLAISVDDAVRGASLINALIAERVQS